jgi:hypothetical protein
VLDSVCLGSKRTFTFFFLPMLGATSLIPLRGLGGATAASVAVRLRQATPLQSTPPEAPVRMMKLGGGVCSRKSLARREGA